MAPRDVVDVGIIFVAETGIDSVFDDLVVALCETAIDHEVHGAGAEGAVGEDATFEDMFCVRDWISEILPVVG